MNIFIYCKEMWRGKDVYRTMMNDVCGGLKLRGRVLDLGSGGNKASYHRFFKKDDSAKIDFLDLRPIFHREDMIVFDFEKDPLPCEKVSVDQILMFNLLEHLYNYNHLLKEAARVLKKNGQIFGSVPFLVGYHPDPRDFFRYTSESLKKIFVENGLGEPQIKILGQGPLVAAFSQLEFMLPRVVKLFLCPVAIFLDNTLFRFRPGLLKEKFALGLFFVATKL